MFSEPVKYYTLLATQGGWRLREKGSVMESPETGKKAKFPGVEIAIQ